MALTTHEKIRVESGFQSVFVREAFRNPVGTSVNTFYVNSDDNVKFVPGFGTGTTIAGVSDVQVWLGVAGVYGVSRIPVTSIDIDQGSVQLSIVPGAGVSLTINYSSSAITSQDIESVRLQAEGIVNQRLSICYPAPFPYTSTDISSKASRLAAAMLLIRGYGSMARDTSDDGYKLYAQLMGSNDIVQGGIGIGSKGMLNNVGEIGLICSPNYQLVDDGGNIIPRTDENVNGDSEFTAGGLVNGVIYDISEEPFRKKEWQSDVNRPQPGSGIPSGNGGGFFGP